MIKLVEDIYDECLEYYGVFPADAFLIKHNDETVGAVDYNVVHDEYIYISYIVVFEDFRRQGIASEVIEHIRNENKGKIMYGEALPNAIVFWKSLGAEFDDIDDEDYLTPFHIDGKEVI